jgi:hypothetical protein
MPRKTFNAGDVLTAADVNEYLMDQSVMTFADSTARGSAIGTAIAQEGMLTYLEDTDAFEYWDGSAFTPLVSSSGAATNAIINGAFEINQRAFTSSTTNASYTFDRWQMNVADGTNTVTSQSFTPGAAPVSGYEASNFIRLQSSGQTANNAISIIQQRIEDVRTFAGETVTLSFFAKANSGTPSIAIELAQNFGSGGSSTVFSIGSQKTAITTSWERYYFTISVPSISGKTIGSGSNLGLFFWLSGGSDFNARTDSLGIQSNTFDIWGVQVEAGSTATPFRRNANSLQGELAACQRYYIRWSQASAFSAIGGFGYGLSSTNAETFFNPLVTMRVAPTSIDYANVAASDGSNRTNTTSVSLTGGSDNRVNVRLVTSSGLTQYRGYIAETTSAGNGFIGLSAEL